MSKEKEEYLINKEKEAAKVVKETQKYYQENIEKFQKYGLSEADCVFSELVIKGHIVLK